MSLSVIRRTASVCPVCLKRIHADIVEDQSSHKVWMKKHCDEHGDFETIIWKGYMPIDDWRGENYPAIDPDEAPSCPNACGLCEHHLQKTCCVVLSVTERCNFHCKFCFAKGGDGKEEDIPLDEIKKSIDILTEKGRTLIQISGGEPTVRDDLPEIIRYAKERGCKYVQLNTNGRRIVREKDYFYKLCDSGLSFVFLQFDGTDDSVYKELRGEELFSEKREVIKICAEKNIGVSLVATVVPGVNDKEVGNILKFGVSHSPDVRGVHFQPAGFLGRIPYVPEDDQRYTLDQLMNDLISQSDGLINDDDLTPSKCDHPLCGFHADYMVLPDGKLMLLSSKRKKHTEISADISCAADKNREFVGRRWLRPVIDKKEEIKNSSFDPNSMDMDEFVKRVKIYGFTVTSMAFQDAGNLDLERLRKCSLHVFSDGKLKPFCSNYLTAWNI